jgi:hypothetical protein
MEILLIGLPISAFVGWMIGKNKKRAGEGAVLGVLLGPLGWLIVACGKAVGMRKCPYCAEEVKSEASVCRFCSRDIPAIPAVQPFIPSPSRPMSARQSAMLILLFVLVVAISIGIGIWKQEEQPQPHKSAVQHYHYENGAITHDQQ